MEFKTSFVDREIYSALASEVSAIIEADSALLGIMASQVPDNGEFCFNVGRLAKEMKTKNPAEFAGQIAQKINDSDKRKLITSAAAVKLFVNLKVDRAFIISSVINHVLSMGDRYGSSTRPQPMRVIIEHTSANPNSPLHVGNLRNTLIGAHLSRMMKFCGCDVKELFYVNDLGGQIGLTALGYNKLERLPEGKIDQTIGQVYAIMNTFSEVQKNDMKLSEFHSRVEAKQAEFNPEEEPDFNKMEKIDQLIYVGADLRRRYPQLYEDLRAKFPDDLNIPVEGAALNKRYELRDPEAVKIIRNMTCATLTGQQETLSTYGVAHDRFDYESEISWDGTSQALIKVFKQSPYFHPETQSNAQGKPEGAYLDIDSFLTDIKAKRGKGGYTTDYPKFYVLRPDASTLYTLRDVAYSMRKIQEADMVLNVICTEQNLPQEKVALTLKALGCERKQFHMAYEVVKLSKEGQIVRMSGRRGIYVLADTLYDEIKDATIKVMKDVKKSHVDLSDESKVSNITHTIANAAMKYALLCVNPRVIINFDIAKAVDPQGNSAPFILYSAVRISSILHKFDEGVKSGKYQPMPEQVDWSLLTDNGAWEILTKYVLPFATMIEQAAIPTVPAEPRLPEFGTHVIPQFAFNLATIFSGFYSRCKILSGDASMYPKIVFCKGVLQVLHNALRLFMVEPLESM